MFDKFHKRLRIFDICSKMFMSSKYRCFFVVLAFVFRQNPSLRASSPNDNWLLSGQLSIGLRARCPNETSGRPSRQCVSACVTPGYSVPGIRTYQINFVSERELIWVVRLTFWMKVGSESWLLWAFELSACIGLQQWQHLVAAIRSDSKQSSNGNAPLPG